MMSAFVIEWKGKIGYGDIVSPICYAYNEAEKRNCDVELNFLFQKKKEDKFKEQDAETIGERIEFIKNNTNKRRIVHDVSVESYYDVICPEYFNHTNYFDNNLSLHNLRISDKYEWKGTGDYIVLITSRKNKNKFSGNNSWKDPYKGHELDHYRKLLLLYPDMDVHYIDYETPIEEAANLIMNCRAAITYHGSAAWLCKWIGCPMIVISSKPSWSSRIFPWAICETKNDFLVDLHNVINRSNLLRNKTMKRLEEYLST